MAPGTVPQLALLIHEELGQPVEAAGALAELAMSKLDKANLMSRVVPLRFTAGMTRRKVLQQLRGVAAAVAVVTPTVMTMVSPPPVLATSGVGEGGNCAFDSNCVGELCCCGADNSGNPPAGPFDQGECVRRYDFQSPTHPCMMAPNKDCPPTQPCAFGGVSTSCPGSQATPMFPDTKYCEVCPPS